MAQKIALTSILLLFLYLIIVAMSIPVMEPDAAIYAEIAREMFSNKTYEITYKAEDWLDKPHFPFWLTALSYSIFGVTLLGYKLPALLASLLAVVYTYKFAQRYYDHRIALLAAAILISAEHFIISINDVRAEPYLMGFMAMAFYHLVVYYEDRRVTDFLLSAFAASLMMMTKGIFVLIPLVTAILAAVLLSKQYRELFRARWYLWLMVAMLFTSPVLIAYYLQFDAQPDKAVDLREWGVQTEVSGIKFFLWDSQFGRFFNSGPIQGEGSFDFYFHTLLWAFWPWGFLFYFAAAALILKLIKGRETLEVYTLFATIPMFLIFSLSSFQLPHYLNILFPFMAVISAVYLVSFFDWSKTLRYIHLGYIWFGAIVFLAIPVIFTGFVFSVMGYILLLAIALLFVVHIAYYKQMIIWFGVTLSILVNLVVHVEFYPRLMNYQASTPASSFISADPEINQLKIASFSVAPRAMEFNLDRLLQPINVCREEPILVLIDARRQSSFKENCPQYTILAEFYDYPVTQLTYDFVNPATRYEKVKRVLLVKTDSHH